MKAVLSLNLRRTPSLHLDIRETHLSLKLQLFKGILFDAFKKEEAENKAKSEDDSDEDPQTYLIYVSNLLHSPIMKLI